MKNFLFVFAFSLIFLSGFARAQTLSKIQMRGLKSVIWQSIHKYHSPDGESEFKGSCDWHSDVHAHWALLSMARVTKDVQLEKKMMSILTFERIKKEYDFLMSPERKQFEKPYGRAWFLLLLKEMNFREISKNSEFQKIRLNLTLDMLSWLQKSNFPENTWDKTLIGSHDSWLMSLFLFDTARSQNSKIKVALADLIQNKMTPLAQSIETHPMDSFDFLYLPALKYLINPDHRYTDKNLNLPTDSKFACHYPGAIQVSLWALSGQCARKDILACAQIQKISNEFYQQTALWKDNFDCVSHWVPQFIWMTHWLSLGKP